MSRSFMKAFHLLPLSFVLITNGLTADPLLSEDFLYELEQENPSLTAYGYEEEDEDADDEEDEEPPEEAEEVAVAPVEAQGPEGKARQLRQERAARIQQQRAPQAQIAAEQPAAVAQPEAQSKGPPLKSQQSQLKRKQAVARLQQQRARRAQAKAAENIGQVEPERKRPSADPLKQKQTTARTTPLRDRQAQAKAPSAIVQESKSPASDPLKQTTTRTRTPRVRQAQASLEKSEASPQPAQRRNQQVSPQTPAQPAQRRNQQVSPETPAQPTPPPQPIPARKQAPANSKPINPSKSPAQQKSTSSLSVRQIPRAQAKRLRTQQPIAQTTPSPKALKSQKRPPLAQSNPPQTTHSSYPNNNPANITDHAPQGINLSARPTLSNGSLWISGDALLWQANQDNLEYTYKGIDDSDNWNIESPSFSWDWGLRVGLGYNIPHDRWDLALVWTNIKNQAKGHSSADVTFPVNTSSSSLYNVWTTSSGALSAGSSAQSHWENTLNQVDLNLGRNFYVGRYLSLHPYAGVRSAWINQKYNVEFQGLDAGILATQTNHMTNHYWGLGFCGGIGTDWMMTKHFSIYGDAGMALMLGFFDVNQQGSQDNLALFNISKSFRAGRPIFDLGLGLKWFTTFCKNRMAFTLKTGYEYHLYCNQNKFLQSNGSANLELFNPVNGDLYYQGGTISGRFDF